MNVTLNETSQADFGEIARQKAFMTNTQNNFSPGKTARNNNTQWTFGGTANVTPRLPALNGNMTAPLSTRDAPVGRFFTTKRGSDSVGQKEDPIQARRLKLSQVAQKEGADKDKDFANMLYGTQHNTQKNLIAVRSIRRSINKTDGATLPYLKASASINRHSAMSGDFGPVKGAHL